VGDGDEIDLASAAHRRMYNQVWTWAGRYRTTERNLAVPYWRIRMDMRDLEADVRA